MALGNRRRSTKFHFEVKQTLLFLARYSRRSPRRKIIKLTAKNRREGNNWSKRELFLRTQIAFPRQTLMTTTFPSSASFNFFVFVRHFDRFRNVFQVLLWRGKVDTCGESFIKNSVSRSKSWLREKFVFTHWSLTDDEPSHSLALCMTPKRPRWAERNSKPSAVILHSVQKRENNNNSLMGNNCRKSSIMV